MIPRCRIERESGHVPEALLAAGIGAQILGVATQGVWHTVLVRRPVGWLTEGRTFVVDHSISNAGIVAMAVGCALILRRRRRPSVSDGLIVIGTAIETIGSVLDLRGHLHGRESRPAVVLIGIGLVSAAAGLMARLRGRWERLYGS